MKQGKRAKYFGILGRVASDSVATSDVYKTYMSQGATNSGAKRLARQNYPRFHTAKYGWFDRLALKPG